MSNNTWNQLWKNIVNNYKEILNINKNSEIINSDKNIKKIYIKKINKRFKQDKNSNKIIINLKDQIYLETSQWYLDETKKLETQIIKFNQNDINFKNASYQNSINEFCQKIFNKEKDYINIINNKCKFLKKTTFDFLIGLKKYFFLYQRIIKETYDAGYNLSKNPNQQKKLLSKIKTKIPTVFNEDIKLFMTLYSLLDKITWEYSISKINESENISILKKHPTMYLYFNNLLAIYRTKNDKFKYWIVKKINLENEIIELIEEKTILKKGGFLIICVSLFCKVLVQINSVFKFYHKMSNCCISILNGHCSFFCYIFNC